MDAISQGRFILGLGSGVKRLNEMWHDVHNFGRPATHLRECVRAIKSIIEGISNGSPVKFEGEYYNIDMRGWEGPHKPVNGNIPIYMAAVQEGMLRAAGDVADGVLGFPMWSLDWVKEVVIPNISKGLNRSGRTRKDIEIRASVTVAITKDKKQGYRDSRGTPGFYTTVRTYQPLVNWHGYAKEATQIREAFTKLKGFGPEVLEPIHDDMVNTFVVVGTNTEVKRRIADFAEICDAIDLVAPHNFISKEQHDEYEKAIFETFSQ